MTDTSNTNKHEILLEHSPLIHRVVSHCEQAGSVPDLEEILQLATENDWGKLVETIRVIMAGNYDQSLLQDLDEEEKIIIQSILNGVDDPSTLPVLPAASADLTSVLAAPGIASLIHASTQGDAESRNVITELTEKMFEEGDDLAIMAGRIRLMVEGERKLGASTENISAPRQQLMTDILTELATLEAK